MTPGSSPTIGAAWCRCLELMPTKRKPVLVLRQMPAESQLGGFCAQAQGIGLDCYGATEVEALDKLAEKLQERLAPALDLGPERLDLL